MACHEIKIKHKNISPVPSFSKNFVKPSSVEAWRRAVQEGETAVHLAAELTSADVHYELEDSDITRLLLEYGGDVNIPTKLV